MSEVFDREIDVRAIVYVGVGLALLVLVPALVVWGLSGALKDRQAAADPPPPVLVEARRPAEIVGPTLQTDPVTDIGRLRDAEAELLDGWAWVDEGARVARVPVDRALDLYVSGVRAVGSAALTEPAPPEGEE